MKILSFSNIKDIITRNMENTKSLDEVFSSIVFKSYQEGFKEGLESAIEELENLKRKMENTLAMQDGEGDFYNGLQVGVNNDLLIINNRIAELKCENNGDNP